MPTKLAGSRSRRSPKIRSPRRSPAAARTLVLTAPVSEVKARAGLEVRVRAEGLDRVELSLEPRGVFTLDVTSLAGSGSVRLLGRRDGVATLVATGLWRGRAVVEQMVHLRCEGPLVRILAMGYTPPADERS